MHLTLCALLALALIGAAWRAHRWRQTPYGRLTLREAVIARITSLLDAPFDPASRDSSNRFTALFLRSLPGDHAVRYEQWQVPGREQAIDCYSYIPEQTDIRGILLWMHGGCWVLGEGQHLAGEHRYIAAQTGFIVVSVNYRLAPEHPYPAALHDCLDVALWLQDNAQRLGTRPEHISLGGSSAGGNLAAALALHCANAPALRFQSLYLQCPVLDLLAPDDWPSYQHCADRYIPTARSMKEAIALYCPEKTLLNDACVSPYRAANLSNLPPTLITIAATDPLRDEALAFAKRARQEGALVEQQLLDNCLHGFIGNADKLRLSSELATRFLNRDQFADTGNLQ